MPLRASEMTDDYHAELVGIGRILERIARSLEQNASTEPFRAVSVPPATPPAPVTAAGPDEGFVHAPGHRPLRRNGRGLYCPTKMADDTWCPWRAGAYYATQSGGVASYATSPFSGAPAGSGEVLP
jgi:hypothetical protein